MKKLIALILLICIALPLCACDASNSSSSNSSSSGYSSSGESTLSARKKIAEQKILDQLFIELHYSNSYRYSDYDVDATGYKVGKVEAESGNYFRVYITIYLYDKYGSLKKTKQLSPRVEVDKYGTVGRCDTIGDLRY